MQEMTAADERHRQSKHRLVVDLSSIAQACHHVGIDHEFGRKVQFEGSGVQVNSARYCFENFLTAWLSVLRLTESQPYQTILVKDGYDSRHLRRLLYPEYKGKRSARPPEMNEQFNAAIDLICKTILELGGTVMEQEKMEADDVIAYLSTGLEGRKTIWSRDGDMLALRSETCDVYLKDTMNPEMHDCAPAPYVLIFKALVGDTSDNLPGAKGFGKGAFTDFVLQYGYDGLDQLSSLIQSRQLQKLQEDGDVNEFKPLKKLVEGADLVYASYDCARFYAHRVNTATEPLRITTGKVEQWGNSKHPSLRKFYGTKRMITAHDFASEMERIHQQIQESPFVALDIETSVPDESLAWTDAINDSKASKKANTVDVFGSELTGMSLTFGPNLQHTIYMPVDHKDTANLTKGQVQTVVGFAKGKLKPIQNTTFELPVLYNTWGEWLDNVTDTADMKSYVDENTPLHLKACSKQYLGYDQVTYEEVTTRLVPVGTLVEGGRFKGTVKVEITPAVIESVSTFDEFGDEAIQRVEVSPAITELRDKYQFQMKELTAQEAFDYGCDDTICTTALFNRYELTMELEGTYAAYRQCELINNYWVAEAFIDGVYVDLAELKKCEEEDDLAYDEAWAKLREHLFRLGWPGTYYAAYELTPASIKEIFEAVMDRKLDCMARKPEKIAQACREQGFPEIADFIENEDEEGFNNYIESNLWSPEPEFDVNKDAHLRELMYERLNLPIRFRTRVTDAQRKRGKKWGEGTPQCDFAAVEHALKLDLKEDSVEYEILSLIRKLNQINTRRQLYYRPYPLYAHWKDGKIHAHLGKNFTATRRFAPSGPNLNQLPKKGEGIKIRSCFVAPTGYLYCPMDFSGQELRLGAERSGDVALTACFVGENKQDPHSLTGAGIALRDGSELGDYLVFEAYRSEEHKDDPRHAQAKAYRDKGKGTNFSSQYLCRAPKLAKLLITSAEEAQKFLDAKNAVFFGLAQWQQDTIVLAHNQGYVTTMLGARRHLHHKLSSEDVWAMQEAERQAVNFEIQGSGAEMTKCSCNSIKKQDLRTKHGSIILFPVHDELVPLVKISEIYEAIPALHACMVQQYADMKIPLESEIKIGPNFGKGLVKVGTEPTRENIVAALVKLGIDPETLQPATNPAVIFAAVTETELDQEFYDYCEEEVEV